MKNIIYDINQLVGKTIKEIKGLEQYSDEVRIFTECGQEFMLYHEEDCCETVALEDYEGDAEEFKGATIISIEEVSISNGKPRPKDVNCYTSWTWTFYTFETNQGGFWMRWLGESNGPHSEDVAFLWVNMPEPKKEVPIVPIVDYYH